MHFSYLQSKSLQTNQSVGDDRYVLEFKNTRSSSKDNFVSLQFFIQDKIFLINFFHLEKI